MIKLHIDGVEICTISPATISLALTSKPMRSVEQAAEDCDFVVEMELSAGDSPAQRLLSGEGYPHDGVPFNHSLHRGEISVEGETIVSGEIYVVETTKVGDNIKYRLRLRRSGAAWAIGAKLKLIHEVSLDYFEQLDIELMEESWVYDTFIKYLPVHRDNYSSIFSTTALDTVRRIRSVDDYHPFVNIHALMTQIFNEQGYDVVSEFMESEAFKQLYISGAYISQNSSSAKEKMDFYAVKMEDRSAEADYRGRVNITPLYSYNSVGFLVDIDSIDEMAECYSLGGCLSIINNVITFTPTQAVSVGFEVRLHYVTDYTIKSRTELKTFDSLYLDGSMIYDYGVANRFRDQRDEPIESLFDYRVVVFDGNASQRYQLSMVINGSEVMFDSWVGRAGEVTTPRFDDPEDVTTIRLYEVSASGSRTLYTDDWALYMGYTEMEGSVEVDVTVRTPPKSATPSSPVKLTAPFIDGATPGMNFTLKAGTSIKPYFAGYPGFGSYVDFSDLMQHEFYAADFIEAVRHLFNLAIYSDTEAKKVYIENEEEIYSSTVWDWSDRVIESEAITYSDVAVDGARRYKLAYQAKDGVANRIKGFYYAPGETYPKVPQEDPEQSVVGASCSEYGTWEVAIDNFVASKSTRTRINPILSPTLNDTLGIPIVGDRDNPDMVDTLDFSPRILSFTGMMYSDNESIPNAVFFSKDQGVNLCFEDREGLKGLNKYYRKAIEREHHGRYVELSLRITPSELIALQNPSNGRANMLSTFGMWISGDWCEGRIESIEMEIGKESVAKCKFLITK